jgi:hypothetical protein
VVEKMVDQGGNMLVAIRTLPGFRDDLRGKSILVGKHGHRQRNRRLHHFDLLINVHKISPINGCVIPTIAENRPAVTSWTHRTAGQAIPRAEGLFGAPPKLQAGRGRALCPPGLFLGGKPPGASPCAGNDNNQEVAMIRAKKARRNADHRQMDMLALLDGAITMPCAPSPRREAGGLDCDQKMRVLLNRAIAAGPFTNRADLAELVGRHAGRPVSKAMIDSWTGASRPHALPAHMIPALCAALGNTILLSGLAEASGCAVTESADLVRSRLDKLTLFIRLARAEQRRLAADMPFFQEARHG